MVDETRGVLVVSQIDEVTSALTFYVVSTALMGLPATRSYEYERRRPHTTSPHPPSSLVRVLCTEESYEKADHLEAKDQERLSV